MTKHWTVRDLIDELETFAADWGDETPVALAQQPRRPHEYSIGLLVLSEFIDNDDGTNNNEQPRVLYIGEGSYVRSLPDTARDDLGWR